MNDSQADKERHFVERTGWLRAAVLGANDGIVSTASLITGVASAGVGRGAAGGGGVLAPARGAAGDHGGLAGSSGGGFGIHRRRAGCPSGGAAHPVGRAGDGATALVGALFGVTLGRSAA